MSLIVLGVCGVFLAGCGRREAPPPPPDREEESVRRREQVLRLNVGAEPTTLDPALVYDRASAMVVYQLFEGLARYGPKGVEPGVASRWEVLPDGLTWRFHLRKAQWSNGEPLTAEDFVHSWKRLLDPALEAPHASMLYFVAGAEEYNRADPVRDKAKLAELREAVGVRAVDSETLEVNLRTPVPFFPALTAFSALFPVSPQTVEADPDGWWSDTGTFVGNGPFRLASVVGEGPLVLVRDDRYWESDRVELRRVSVLGVSDPAEFLAMLEGGDIDVVSPRLVPLNEVTRLFDIGLARRAPLLGGYYLAFNTRRGPFRDLLVRHAFNLAVNRNALVSRVLKGLPPPALAFVPPGITDPATGQDFRRSKGDFFRDGDAAAARDLLEQAGYAEGKGLPPVKLLVNAEGENVAVMETLRQQWRESLGVEVEIVSLPWNEFLAVRETGDYDLVRGGWIGAYPDPQAFLSLYRRGDPGNLAGWSNPFYDELLGEAMAESSPVRRVEFLHRAEAVLMDDMPVLPLYFLVQVWLEQETVEGTFVDLQGNLYLRSARLAEREEGDG